MCGRYSLRDPHRCFDEFSILEKPAALEPRYNIAPSQGVWAIRIRSPGLPRELCLLRWGFPISNARDGKATAMARAETLLGRSAFADAFASRRCLLVADGFYEWKRSANARSFPHYIHRRGGAPFAMAAIWQPAAARELDGCAVITRPARAPVDAVHDRMPAILSPRHHDAWLDPTFRDPEALGELLFADPPSDLEVLAVGPRVNSVAHDDPSCVAPASESDRLPEQLALFSR
jgi:putative SOS response-associated peptidase YedK